MALKEEDTLTNWTIDVGSNQEKYCELLHLSRLAVRFGVGIKDFKAAMDSEKWKLQSRLSRMEIEEIWLFVLRQDLLQMALSTMVGLTNYQRQRLTKTENLRTYVLPIFCLDYFAKKNKYSLKASYVHFFGNPDRKAKPPVKESVEKRERRRITRQIKEAKACLTECVNARARIDNLEFVDQELQHPDLQLAVRTTEAE
jgi:hypothetical protein